jgi:hypothetical protein
MSVASPSVFDGCSGDILRRLELTLTELTTLAYYVTLWNGKSLKLRWTF